MKVTTLILILFSATAVFSQKEGSPTESPQTFIFKLTNDEAKEIFEGRKLEVQDRYFHTLTDTFSTTGYQRKLLPGHYLFVKARWENLEIELKSVNSITAQVLNNERDFAVSVADSLGNLIENATVFLGKKKVPFDAKTKTYRLKKRNKEGLLQIETVSGAGGDSPLGVRGERSGEILFYQAEKQYHKPLIIRRYKRFKYTKAGRWVTLPVEIISAPFKYVHTGIKYRNWRIRLPFRRMISDWENRDMKGYVVTNKPKYQPGDTVKVKAYVARPNGKPRKKKIDFQFSTGGKIIFGKELQPDPKGNVVYEFVLGDSLKLDKQYNLRFDVLKKWRWNSLNHQIYYEDYQLDEVVYTFKSSKDSYLKNDKIILLAEGKDKNGFTIPDGQVQLIATTGNAGDFYEKEVLVPDTLWIHEQALDTRGETQIILPDSILPPADLGIQVQAYFSNSSGEIHEKRANFSKMRTTGKIELELEDGFVIANYFEDGDTITAEGILSGFNDGQLQFQQTVNLPVKTKINPFVEKYELQIGDWKRISSMKGYDGGFKPRVSAFGNRTVDSVFIQIKNPNKIPVNWIIQTTNKVIKRGTTEESQFFWKGKNTGNTVYFLKYDYVWGGRENFAEETFQPYKKLLNISVEQPENISPGESVPVKIKVENYKEEPVKNVNLAAGAINAQFNSSGNFKAPSVNYKRPKKPFPINKFDLEKVFIRNWKTYKDLTRDWYEKMGLDSLLFYKMRYENDGVFMHYDTITRDTFYKNVAQFAPYLIKENRAEPIYLIYCNNELVYWYDVDDNPPYSFVGREGWNTILIRTRDREYKMDSVWLKKGHKLELAIDIDHYSKSKYASQIKQARTQKELTDFEKDLLRKRILFLVTAYNGRQNHLWQTDKNIRIFNQKNQPLLAIGPFKGYRDMTFMTQGGFSNTFLFEPGFQYDILQNRERLYADRSFAPDLRVYLRRNDLKKPRQVIYAPSDIKNDFPEKLEVFYSYPAHQTNPGNGRFQIKSDPDTLMMAFILEKDDTTRTVFRPNQTVFRNLEPGQYTFYGFTFNRYYFKKDIQIRPDTLLFNDFSEVNYQTDSTIFARFFKKGKLKSTHEKNPDFDYSSSREYPQFPPGVGRGRYISGQLTDESGEALIGASVLVRGTANGTVSDIDGFYELWVPSGFDEIVVSYTGFATQITEIGGSRILDFSLHEDAAQLNEVVVTGLGRRRVFAKTSESFLYDYDIQNLPTKNINALAATTSGVYAFDGEELRGRTAGVIISGSRKNETDYYLDGMRVSGDLGQETDSVLDLNLGTSGIRTNFSDYAFWKPYLLTDQNGEACFQATYPDNITGWKTFVVGQDAKSRGGVGYADTRAFKKLTAQLAMPRFLIEGDETNIVGRSVNYTNDSFEIRTTFRLEEEILKENEAEIGEALIEKVEIKVPPAPLTPKGKTIPADSLEISYSLSMGNYEDGEVREIPIYPIGVDETVGGFHILEGDTSLNLSFDKNRGAVSIFAENDVLEVLLEDIEYLKKYPYGCNEQTASRLTALLLEKQIREHLGQPFEHEKALISMIVRLKKSQNSNGSWGWWSQGHDNIWMTTYVLRALYEARTQNYRTEAFEKGIRFLTNSVHNFRGKDLLNTLQLFSDIGQNFDYQPFIENLDTTLNTLYDKFALLQIRQAQGLEMTLDSLEKYKKQTLFGGIFWNNDRYDWYNNSIQTTLLAYRIYKKAGHEDVLSDIRQYFLEKRADSGSPIGVRGAGWQNTIETARILATILPDLTKKMKTEKGSLRVGDKFISEFPFQTRIASENIQIRKSGGGQLYFTAYQTFRNKAPNAKSDIFEIETHLEQNGKKTKHLEHAEKAVLVVRLNVKKAADYAMIEVPIPAGCSYGSKSNFRRFPEVHREYFREKTSIFCEELPIGEYVFKIDLEPRFTGNYTLNPAKAEQMYFPVFYGRNELKKVKID